MEKTLSHMMSGKAISTALRGYVLIDADLRRKLVSLVIHG